MKMNYRAKSFLGGLATLLLFTTACVPYSKINYFNDIDKLSEPVANPMKLKPISPFDELQVTVLSTDEQTANLLNYSRQSNSDNTRGYVVDETGNISFPFVGKIQVGGLTLLEAGNEISKTISSIITKPVVLVSFMESKITVMGEVGTQGTFSINKDFINIYESLALGGGLSQYADRKKVILLRQENNKLMHYKLDLTNSKISSSPLFYILPNDIIIVEPLRNKSWNYQNAIFNTFLSAVTTIVGIIFITNIRTTPSN